MLMSVPRRCRCERHHTWWRDPHVFAHIPGEGGSGRQRGGCEGDRAFLYPRGTSSDQPRRRSQLLLERYRRGSVGTFANLHQSWKLRLAVSPDHTPPPARRFLHLLSPQRLRLDGSTVDIHASRWSFRWSFRFCRGGWCFSESWGAVGSGQYLLSSRSSSLPSLTTARARQGLYPSAPTGALQQTRGAREAATTTKMPLQETHPLLSEALALWREGESPATARQTEGLAATRKQLDGQSRLGQIQTSTFSTLKDAVYASACKYGALNEHCIH